MENQNSPIDSILETNEKNSNTIEQIIEAMQEPNADYQMIINRLMGISEELIRNNMELVNSIGYLAKKNNETLEDKHRIEARNLYQSNPSETGVIDMKIRQKKETEQYYQDYGKFGIDTHYEKTLTENYTNRLATIKNKHNQIYTQMIAKEANVNEETLKNSENALPGDILTF